MFLKDGRVGICFIFNHPFPKQIPILKRLYGSRFEKMLFIVPFHDVDDEDVVTVYRGGFGFDAMVVDARDTIKRKFQGCSHVLFVHNDLLLSGLYDEKSAYNLLGLRGADTYITEFKKVGDPVFKWVWFARLPYKWRFPMDPLLGNGAEKAKDYLPDLNAVKAKCAEAGVDGSPSYLIRHLHNSGKLYFYPFIDQQIFSTDAHLDEQGKFEFEYPLFYGYSDIWAVPVKGIDRWFRTLGVLSAMELFPEVSIPTSLIWTFGKINTAESVGVETSILWKYRRLADKIAWVIRQYRAGVHYIHPVKYEKYSEADYDRLLRVLGATAVPQKVVKKSLWRRLARL